MTADPSSAPPKNSVQLSESAEGFDLLVVTLGALASAPGCAFTLDLASQADDIAGGKTFAVLAPVTAWWMNNRMVVGTIVVDGPSVSVSVEKMYSFGSDGLVLDDSLSDFVGIVRVAGVRT